MQDKVDNVYRIEVLTPTGWVTRTPTYESEEFALKDARAEVTRYGDKLRVATFTRTKVQEITDG